jgi:hypothetical protein
MEIFIATNVLESWAVEGKAELQASSLKLEGRGLSKSLQPAIHVMALVSGDDKDRQLVGTVRTQSEISALGGEVYFNSLLINEDAYTVESGFLATF